MSLGDVVRAVLAELGPADRARVAGVVLVVKELPDVGDMARGCEPGQYAAYHGRALELHRPPEPTGGEWEEVLPPPGPERCADGTVTLFVGNLAPLTYRRVRIALLHELAHVLGWEEGEIRSLGLHLDGGGKQRCSSGQSGP